MRVNARLDDEAQQQIDYLTAATGMGVSQVLRESVALYYRQARASAGGAKHLLAMAGKGASGRSDIASNVKGHLAEGLGGKYAMPAPRAPRAPAPAGSAGAPADGAARGPIKRGRDQPRRSKGAGA
jgi:hypothetical protein